MKKASKTFYAYSEYGRWVVSVYHDGALYMRCDHSSRQLWEKQVLELLAAGYEEEER